MYAIVRLALKYRYTAIVLAIFISIFGVSAAMRAPADIFPDIDIPVIAVGHFQGDVFVSDQILVKHTATYIAQYPSRVTAPNGSKR